MDIETFCKEICKGDFVEKESMLNALTEYENKIRADAIDEYFAKFDNWIKSDSKLSYFWTEFQVEARRIAEQLKSQNN